MVAASSQAPEGATKLVCFHLHGQLYGADIDDVVESMSMRPITHVFLTPDWLLGIINLRGEIVAVLDLAQLLGMSPTVITEDSRIIIVRGRGRRAGIICDALAELRSVSADQIDAPPVTLGEETAELLTGVVTADDESTLRVLDLGQLFQSRRMHELGRQEN